MLTLLIFIILIGYWCSCRFTTKSETGGAIGGATRAGREYSFQYQILSKVFYYINNLVFITWSMAVFDLFYSCYCLCYRSKFDCPKQSTSMECFYINIYIYIGLYCWETRWSRNCRLQSRLCHSTWFPGIYFNGIRNLCSSLYFSGSVCSWWQLWWCRWCWWLGVWHWLI